MKYEVASKTGSCLYRGADLELACEIYDAYPDADLCVDPLRQQRLVADARAAERQSFGRDLHDCVGPALTGLAMYLRALQQSHADRSRRERIYDEMAAEVALAIAEVRAVIDRLSPPTLDDGLRRALSHEVLRSGARSGLRVELEAPGHLPMLPPEVEADVYRIVSEALLNAIRHSSAELVVVHVRLVRRGVEFEVTDDGAGDGSDTLSRIDGVGMRSMRERAENLGAELVIERRPLRGTRVLLRLPIGPEAEVGDDGLLAAIGG